MDLSAAIKARHSVRSFTDRRIDGEIETVLCQMIDECSQASGLHIQLCLNEPRAFDNMRAKYGKFQNCKNYIALAGKSGSSEKCGYYGEKLVLKAQQLGLNSCWAAISYSKSKVPCVLAKGEKIRLVIALGYGISQGVEHRSKDMKRLCQVKGEMPEWFRRGMAAAMLAPTAMNQQKFVLTLHQNTVSAKPLIAFYSRVDLGIVKCHFEIGAGDAIFKWQ